MCDPGRPSADGDQAAAAFPVDRAALAMADGVELPTLTCVPAAATTTVVVAPDLFGLSATTSAVLRRLAAAGLASVALGYHHRVSPDTPEDAEAARDRRRAMDETLAVADLSSVVDAVRRADGASTARIAVLGLCMGGTMALALAAARGDLAAVSCYGFPRSSKMPAVACPAPLELAGAMSGPVLGVWGDADSSVPAADVRALAEAYRAHGVDAEIHLVPGVGHSFLTTPDAPSRAAAEQIWPRITRFIQERCAPTPGAGSAAAS